MAVSCTNVLRIITVLGGCGSLEGEGEEEDAEEFGACIRSWWRLRPISVGNTFLHTVHRNMLRPRLLLINPAQSMMLIVVLISWH